ncbi:hypothetical protein ACTQ45_12580 [Fundicoccus sp. Sow4_D5]|uniref:hypothetical protein n=1 Tax=unclassified Fundicoccus TaxID=2761543 RepID=UPI003F932AE8
MNHYHAYSEEGPLMIDLQIIGYGTEYGLILHYDFENFVPNYEDVSVIETLKANGDPLQDDTS